MSEKLEYKKIDTILEKIADRFNFTTGKGRPTLYSVWEKIVGERLCLNCKLYDIKGTTIIIEVNHTGVAQQIRLQTKKILYNISKYYPELKIDKIETKLNTETPELKKAPEQKREIIENTPTPLKLNEELPPELKNIFKQMKKELKKKK